MQLKGYYIKWNHHTLHGHYQILQRKSLNLARESPKVGIMESPKLVYKGNQALRRKMKWWREFFYLPRYPWFVGELWTIWNHQMAHPNSSTLRLLGSSSLPLLPVSQGTLEEKTERFSKKEPNIWTWFSDISQNKQLTTNGLLELMFMLHRQWECFTLLCFSCMKT